jgi:hypothetical protein
MKDHELPSGIASRQVQPWAIIEAIGWLERIDPGAHRRIKGLRLVPLMASQRCWECYLRSRTGWRMAAY